MAYQKVKFELIQIMLFIKLISLCENKCKPNAINLAHLSSVQFNMSSADLGRFLLSLQSLKNDLWKDSAYVSLWLPGVVINFTYCSKTWPLSSRGSMEAWGSTLCIVCKKFKATTTFSVLSPAFIPVNTMWHKILADKGIKVLWNQCNSFHENLQVENDNKR